MKKTVMMKGRLYWRAYGEFPENRPKTALWYWSI